MLHCKLFTLTAHRCVSSPERTSQGCSCVVLRHTKLALMRKKAGSANAERPPMHGRRWLGFSFSTLLKVCLHPVNERLLIRTKRLWFAPPLRLLRERLRTCSSAQTASFGHGWIAEPAQLIHALSLSLAKHYCSGLPQPLRNGLRPSIGI